MKNLLALVFLFSSLVGVAQYDTSDEYIGKAGVVELQKRVIGESEHAHIRRLDLYRRPLNTPVELGSDVWGNLDFLYLIQSDFSQSDSNFPDIPVGSDDLAYIYIYQSRNNATSMGVNDVVDIPLTWRNATGAYRINFERNLLSSQQQVDIVKELEREILAGLSENYTNTSTSTRLIDFQSTNSNANGPLIQADLVAEGWTIINGTSLYKDISANGTAARRWRVLHNN